MSARDLLVEGAPGIVRLDFSHFVHISQITEWQVNEHGDDWKSVNVYCGKHMTSVDIGAMGENEFARVIAIAYYEARTGHRAPEDFGEEEKRPAYAHPSGEITLLPKDDNSEFDCPECKKPIKGPAFQSKEHGRDVCFPCRQKLNAIRREKDKKEKEASDGK